jgi:hypothetical protein
VAGPLARLAPRSAKPLIWISLLGLASTRILLLAHYANDVAAGLIIGAGLGKAVRKLTRDFGERVVRHADRLGHGRIGLTLEEAADDAAGGTESARTRTPAVCRPAGSLMRRG